MDPGTLALGLTSAALALMVPTVFAPAWLALRRRGRREWVTTFDGRTIQVLSTQNKKQLLVDGQIVAAKTTLSGAGASLTWSYQGETGPPVEIVATITYAGATPSARILANGRPIGGDPLALPTSGAEPKDPRWTAAQVLLADLRGAQDTRVRDAGARAEAGLRDLLGRHARLASAREAHATLGGDPSEIDSARTRVDGQVGELIDALRQLHLLAVADEPALALDPIEDTLGRIAAEAEVADLDTRRPRQRQTV